MPDQFDTFLTQALTPKRAPDRQFVARVQARIALDQRLEAERRGIVRGFGTQLLALIAVAAAVVWVGRAQPISQLAADSPVVVLCGLLAVFTLTVFLFISQSRAEIPLNSKF